MEQKQLGFDRKKIRLSKSMRTMLICVLILLGGIFLFKGIQKLLINHFIAESAKKSVITVSALKAVYQKWQPQLLATGSLRAVRGVTVTTELGGLIRTIYFSPGAEVKEGDILVQLNADADLAQLAALQAQSNLAAITLKRDKAQLSIGAVSQAVVDADIQNFNNFTAQTNAQAAIVSKKTIKAPFSGRLGISNINPGQFLNPGDGIVLLETLNPIYVDFYVPQQALSKLVSGARVSLTTDAYPQKVFKGTITTIDPAIDTATRNVRVEATLENANSQLYPGMFGYVEVKIGEAETFITLPQTAISFESFGELVYIITPTTSKKNKGNVLIVKQRFVKTGERRGDKIAILEGVKEGEIVVTAGQLKLKNGSVVSIRNTPIIFSSLPKD